MCDTDDGMRSGMDGRRTTAPGPRVGRNETDPKGPDLETPHTPNARGGDTIPYRNRVNEADKRGRAREGSSTPTVEARRRESHGAGAADEVSRWGPVETEMYNHNHNKGAGPVALHSLTQSIKKRDNQLAVGVLPCPFSSRPARISPRSRPQKEERRLDGRRLDGCSR